MTYLKFLGNNPLKSYGVGNIIFALVPLTIDFGTEIKKCFEQAENRYAGVLDDGEDEYYGRACAARSVRALHTSDMRRSKMTGNELETIQAT
jgi:hypothetical protein